MHPLLEACGVTHGFGVKGWLGPAGLVRPVQVHGHAVARVARHGDAEPAEADAIWSQSGGPPVAVVTADCVPILVASPAGERVAAIHAGWRGLAAGVIEAGIAAISPDAAASGQLVAAIGPHAGACCYEVDAPVRDAFAGFGADVGAAAFRDAGPGHWMCDLAVLARAALVRAGLLPAHVGVLEGACTVCDPGRFESYRRDGGAAGRLVHAIAPAAASGTA
jgi:YfiH family protein